MVEMLCKPGFRVETGKGSKNRGKFRKLGLGLVKIGEAFGDRVLILTLYNLT